MKTIRSNKAFSALLSNQMAGIRGNTGNRSNNPCTQRKRPLKTSYHPNLRNHEYPQLPLPCWMLTRMAPSRSGYGNVKAGAVGNNRNLHQQIRCIGSRKPSVSEMIKNSGAILIHSQDCRLELLAEQFMESFSWPTVAVGFPVMHARQMPSLLLKWKSLGRSVF